MTCWAAGKFALRHPNSGVAQVEAAFDAIEAFPDLVNSVSIVDHLGITRRLIAADASQAALNVREPQQDFLITLPGGGLLGLNALQMLKDQIFDVFSHGKQNTVRTAPLQVAHNGQHQAGRA